MVRSSSFLFSVCVALCIVLAAHAWPLDSSPDLDKLVKIIKHPKAKRPPVQLPSHPAPPPVKLPPHQPQQPVASVCGAIKDCERCTSATIKVKNKADGLHCAWLNDGTGKCVQRIMNTPNLVTSAPQCAVIREQQKAKAAAQAKEKARVAAATHLWSSIAVHVLDGRSDKDVSGRHLASKWIPLNGAVGININHATGLAQIPYGQGGKKTKTVWLDTEATAPYTGAYTPAHVEKMCIAAAAASMRVSGMSPPTLLSGVHGFAVRSPVTGVSLCIKITKDSCYPADIAPTAHAVGTQCTTSSKESRLLPID